MAFLAELAALRRPGHASGRRTRAGRLDLDAILGDPEDDTLVYTCGPERLLADIEARMEAWPHGALHLERFARQAAGRARAGGARSRSSSPGAAGRSMVPPGRSILSIVEEAGVGVLSSCAHGTCGTCDTAVLEGIPEHRDSVLTPDEQAVNDCMMICVSRARSERLVLNL